MSASQEQALRRVLYGLSAVVTVHFAKEEEVYLPILDARLIADEAHQLFEAMERAAPGGQELGGVMARVTVLPYQVAWPADSRSPPR